MTEHTYRIGEAARLLNLETYVLRFWETEFTQLKPLRTAKGQRLYTETHLKLLRQIQNLLYDQGMTIEGARRVLTGCTNPRAASPFIEIREFPADRKSSVVDADEICKENFHRLMERKNSLESELSHVHSELLALRQLLQNESRS